MLHACLHPAWLQFGKRLLGEASRRWSHSYIDYKQLKHAIKLDVAAAGKQSVLLSLLLGQHTCPHCPSHAGNGRQLL